MAKFNFAGLVAGAKTVREARAKLEERFKALLAQMEGPYMPILIRYEGYTCVVWRVPETGWTYKIMKNAVDDRGPEDGRVAFLHGGVSADLDREKCERAARRHLAQMVWTPTGLTGVGIIDNDADQTEHIEWTQWQHRYRAAKAAGATDDDAHKIAGGMLPMPTPIVVSRSPVEPLASAENFKPGPTYFPGCDGA